MTSHEILFKELTLIVEGTYYKGSYGDLETPPEEQEFEIEKVMTVGDINVIDLLSDEDIFEIEKIVIDNHYN